MGFLILESQCLFGDGVLEECPVPVAEKLWLICDGEADLLLLWWLYRLYTVVRFWKNGYHELHSINVLSLKIISDISLHLRKGKVKKSVNLMPLAPAGSLQGATCEQPAGGRLQGSQQGAVCGAL